MKATAHPSLWIAERTLSNKEAVVRLMESLKKAEGGSYTGKELNEFFNFTPAALHRRRKEHRIVSWRDPQGVFHYPKWQFNNAGVLLAGVQDVLQTFCSFDEWRIVRYFLTPRHQLGNRSPLEILRAGRIEDVVNHAKIHSEENSW